MHPADKLLNTLQRRALYMLERQYGGRVDYYRLLDSTTDVKTGRKVITKRVITIPRGVILPTQISREAVRSISQISANKKFVTGGEFDSGLKTFIVRASYLPEGVQQDDWIVYKNRRFDIIRYAEYEFDGSFVLDCKEVKGVRPPQILSASGRDYVTLSEESVKELTSA
jgi:hypothetical protein